MEQQELGKQEPFNSSVPQDDMANLKDDTGGSKGNIPFLHVISFFQYVSQVGQNSHNIFTIFTIYVIMSKALSLKVVTSKSKCTISCLYVLVCFHRKAKLPIKETESV